VIENTGFNDCESITVLGMELKKNYADTVASAYEKIRSKIIVQVNFWKRFNLSLPGRIEVAKTFLCSQINYLGCFLNFDKVQTTGWEDLIFSFVRGNLNTSKTKVFNALSLGGMGLLKLKVFWMPKNVGGCLGQKRIHLTIGKSC
jgi:hypothetical protein